MRECSCSACGKNYEIPTGEYNRKRKLKTKFYCSLSCAAKQKRHNPYANSEENKAHLRNVCNNRRDELSPFRELLKRCRARDKEVNVDLEYLKEIWEKQEGICPYLRQQLVLPLSNYSHDQTNPNLIASLDRIDSDQGYVVGNIQFISMTLNFAKNKFDEAVLLNLIALIKDPSTS
jgi:hypothetical protein